MRIGLTNRCSCPAGRPGSLTFFLLERLYCVQTALLSSGQLSLVLSLSIITAVSIGRTYPGKEIDIQEGNETQGSEGENGARS